MPSSKTLSAACGSLLGVGKIYQLKSTGYSALPLPLQTSLSLIGAALYQFDLIMSGTSVVKRYQFRVATNLENLEYSGISLNMENSGNSQGIMCNLRENCNKQSIFSLSFKYLCKTAVDWVNRIIKSRDEVRVWWWPVILLELMWNDDPWWSFITFTFCCDNLWKSKFMALEKPGKLRIFSPTLWPPCSYLLWWVAVYSFLTVMQRLRRLSPTLVWFDFGQCLVLFFWR